MKVALTRCIDRKIPDKSMFTINDLSNELKAFFLERSYGGELEELYIGIICVSEVFKQFFKPRKTKYTKSKKDLNAKLSMILSSLYSLKILPLNNL